MKKIATTLLVFLLLPLLLLCGCESNSEGDILFMVDGEVYASYLEDGYPTDPVKEGYVFAGWYYDEGTWTQPFLYQSSVQPVGSAQNGKVNIVLQTKEYDDSYSFATATDENGKPIYSIASGEGDKYYAYVSGATDESRKPIVNGDYVIIGSNPSNQIVYQTGENGDLLFQYVVAASSEVTSSSETVYVYAKFVKATEQEVQQTTAK